jgi:hypothetical protein
MRNSSQSFGLVTHNREGTRTRTAKPEYKLNDLDYADDIALLESLLENAQAQLERINTEANKVGLEINVDKTKLMVFNPPNHATQQTLNLNNECIEVVRDFKYLGSMMDASTGDIKARKGQAWGAFWELKDIWKSNNVSIKSKPI